MTREEAIKILSILKAAYPNSYKGMTKDEALGTVGVWAAQFSDVPYFIVSIAVNKLIGTNTFPPAINEVKNKIRSIYFEAQSMLDEHRRATTGFKITTDPNEKPKLVGTPLDTRTLELVQKIVDVCGKTAYSPSLEPKLKDMLCSSNAYLLGE